MILSLKENLDDPSGLPASTSLDLLGLINSLEYVNEVVSFVAAKTE